MEKHEDRPRGPLTVEFMLALLAERGLLSPEQREMVLTREERVAARVAKQKQQSLGGLRTGTYQVSPIELIAAFEFENPRGQALNEERLMTILAEAVGVPYEKIDPVKLDARLITNTLSRPFARSNTVLPLRSTSHGLTVAVENPFDLELLHTLRSLTGSEVEIVLASRTDILRMIAEIYGFRTSVQSAERDLTSGPDLGNLEQFVRLKSVEEIEATDKHVVNAVDYILRYALDQGASDIHIEPKRDHAIVRMRIDGVLHSVHRVPKVVHPAIISRLKTMARMDIAEKRRPQDGRIKTEYDKLEVELRLSTLPVAFGEKVVIRIFDPQVLLRSLTDLGFAPKERALYTDWIKQPHGIVLVCGPTGSGKTTTLYSTLKELAAPAVNVTTIEDPIEMVVDAFNQTAINPRAGITFASSLRTLLRQDPDIIMVGEIRDPETAYNAIQAALTGHLVFSTLHTVDAAGAVTRMLNLDVPPFLLASTLIGVVAQRLLRLVCESCAEESRLTPEARTILNLPGAAGHGHPLTVRRGSGCQHCRGTGLKGRTGIFELLASSERIRGMVAQRTDSIRLTRTAIEDGMTPLREAATRKLVAGLTSYEEVLRVTADLR